MNVALHRKMREHGLSIVTIGLLFAVCSIILTPGSSRIDPPKVLQSFVDLPYLNLDDPLHFALLTDALALDKTSADSLFHAYVQWKESLTLQAMQERNRQSLWDWVILRRLFGMSLQFAVVYFIVLGISYFGARALGTYQFCASKSGKAGPFWQFKNDVKTRPGKNRQELGRYVMRLLKHGAMMTGMIFAFLVVFSPAYVPAYALKSYINTDSVLLMVLLAVGTNGLLVAYAQKYRSLLSLESRKGYVETAMVKGLSSDFRVPWTRIIRGQFDGHVLQHIVANADYQYWTTFKEQASFIVTGLVIIEMALNMQGRLCYEMLQHMLYRNIDIVFAIMMGLFLLIKLTEAAVDAWTIQLGRKYDNAE